MLGHRPPTGPAPRSPTSAPTSPAPSARADLTARCAPATARRAPTPAAAYPAPAPPVTPGTSGAGPRAGRTRVSNRPRAAAGTRHRTTRAPGPRPSPRPARYAPPGTTPHGPAHRPAPQAAADEHRQPATVADEREHQDHDDERGHEARQLPNRTRARGPQSDAKPPPAQRHAPTAPRPAASQSAATTGQIRPRSQPAGDAHEAHTATRPAPRPGERF